MLTVADFETIRKCVKNEGLSQRETARKLGHSRHNVKKALAHAAPPGYRQTGTWCKVMADDVDKSTMKT